MSGLLDKANATKDESVIEAEVIEAETIVEEIKAAPAKDSSSSSGLLTDNSSEANPLSFANISSNGKIGYGLALVGFILMWFLGSYELQDYLGPIPFGIVPLTVLAISFYMVWDAIGREKTLVLVVGYLMITTIPYLAGMSFQNSAVGISDLSVDEDNDELTFMVRGAFDSATASISANGVEVWSENSDMANDMRRFSVGLDDIFTANSEDYDSKVVTDYKLTVTSSSGGSNTISITPSLMNREMNDASVKFSTLTEIISDDTTDESRVVAKGIRIELALGLMNPNIGPMNGGESSLGVYKTIPADYSTTINIKYNGNVVWTHNTIAVDGIAASWTSQVSGAVTGQTVYWMGLSGTAEDDAGAEYLERDQFYEDDGCYTFEVTITNDLYSSSPTTVIDEYAWDLTWDEDESQSGEAATADYEVCN